MKWTRTKPTKSAHMARETVAWPMHLAVLLELYRCAMTRSAGRQLYGEVIEGSRFYTSRSQVCS